MRRRGRRGTLTELGAVGGGESADRLAVRDEVARAIARLSADEQILIGLRFVAQFGDLRLETEDYRVVVEFESAGGVTNLAKYWPLLRGDLRQKRFLLLHVFYVSSRGDHLAHRKLWEFVVKEMQRDETLGQDWDAQLETYGPGATDDPFPRLVSRIRLALGLDTRTS